MDPRAAKGEAVDVKHFPLGIKETTLGNQNYQQPH